MEKYTGNMNQTQPMEAPAAEESVFKPKVGEERIREALKTLQQYKSGKARLEHRIIASEQWWKMRHWEWMEQQGNPYETHYTTAWLFNVIAGKHADGIQGYPQPNILPREEDDKETAQTLREIIPCVLEQNDFEETYSDVLWQKLKQGTGVYGVFWDASKLNGLGDISIRKIDLLNLFWEPGITDIQKSQNVFHVELVDNEVLEQKYPQLKGKLMAKDVSLSKYLYDDSVDTTKKSPVVDWYYHTYDGGKKLLQYCKFVGNTVLYASENDTETPMQDVERQIGTDIQTGAPITQMVQEPVRPATAETGWYAHGEYPFVFDRMYPIEGSPTGFGYVDICKSAQEQIDLMNSAIVKNTIAAATPRYFMREDGGINEAEFADTTKPIVHANSNLSEDTLRQIEMTPVHGNYIAILNNKITEMKETASNTDASNGITGGVTAASGIAAQQEAAGKTSRDATMTAYRAFRRVVNQVIELIRQFYDAPRQFRITGKMGQPQFVSFDNSGMQPVAQGQDFGIDMGYRLPVFDVTISAQSKTIYTQNAQNELAMALNSMGVFNPQMVDSSLLLLDTMDFQGKEELMNKVSQFGTIYQMFAQVSQIALALAQQYDPATADMLANVIMQRQGMTPMMPAGAPAPDLQGEAHPDEVSQVRKAREHANNSSQVTT